MLEVCPGSQTTGCPTVDCLPANAAACAVPNLTAGTAYTIKVAAVKNGQPGLPSTPATVTPPFP